MKEIESIIKSMITCVRLESKVKYETDHNTFSIVIPEELYSLDRRFLEVGGLSSH